MKIERHKLERQTIEGFAGDHDLIMVVKENYFENKVLYSAQFKDTRSIGWNVQGNTVGYGDSEGRAIKDYAKKISKKVLVVRREGGKGERRISVPLLEYYDVTS